MRACCEGLLEDARNLIDQGADVNLSIHLPIVTGTMCNSLASAAQGVPWTALSLAVFKSSTDVVQLLLDAQAHPNLQLRSNGDQPLTVAAYLGHVNKMQCLLQARAFVDEAPRINSSLGGPRTSALLDAAREGHVEAVRLLLAYRASIKTQAPNGMNALMLATSNAFCPRYDEVVKVLLDAGSDACGKLPCGGFLNAGRTVLMLACKNGRPSVVSLLLDWGAGAVVGALDSNGSTAMVLSIWRDCDKVMKLLLSATVDANNVDGKGNGVAYYKKKFHGKRRKQSVLESSNEVEEDSHTLPSKALMREAGTWEDNSNPTGSASSSALVLGDTPAAPIPPTVAHEPADRPSATTVLPAEQNLTQLHKNGVHNWVFHKGQPINLEDELDTAHLSESELAMLLAQACAPRSPSHPLPLQPWEMDKMLQIAEQTIAAIDAGRYISQYGEVLLNMLRGWPGDAKWVNAEVGRIEQLVTTNDAASLAALRREINESLVATLREVQKDLNRLQLENPEPVVSHRNLETVFQRTMAESKLGLGDTEEEAALKQAIVESMAESMSPMAVAAGTTGNDASVGSASVEESIETKSAAECSAGIYSVVTGTVGSCDTTAGPFCDHTCNVVSNRQGQFRTSCCHCVCRGLRDGVLPGLDKWWRMRGICVPHVEEGLRFFCGSCSIRFEVVERNLLEALPVPFGGNVLRAAAWASSSMRAEVVQPVGFHKRKHGGDSIATVKSVCNDVDDALSDTSSWVLLDNPEDEGCWEVVDALSAVTIA